MKNKHTKRIEAIFKNTNESQYEKFVEEDILYVLVSIAESLAAIADLMEEQAGVRYEEDEDDAT